MMRSSCVLIVFAACAARTPPPVPPPPASSGAVAARLRALEERIAAHPDDADALLEAGLLHERLGDRLRAQQYLGRAAAAGAEPRRALPALVRVAVALRDYPAAIRDARTYEEVLAPDCEAGVPGGCPRLAEVRAALGEMLAAIGEDAEARALFAAALRADAGQPDARRALARMDAEASP